MASEADIKRMLSGRYREDLRRRQAQENKRREQAEKEERKELDPNKTKATFLRPQDLQDGEYDLKRSLRTTLGIGEKDMPREITRDDIVAFAHNINVIKERYVKGITARDVIDFSHPDDIKRANEQIKFAAPVSRKAGIVQFMTNAGPQSKKVNHYVRVEFLNFDSVVTNPDKQGKTTIKNRLADGKLRFECDCERHTYWYRYMATIGGYSIGRKEPGFPKVRNPKLYGVACKHVLRVMQFIRSASSQQYLVMAVEKDRKNLLGKAYVHSEKAIKDQLSQQQASLGSKRSEIVPKANKTMTEMMQRSAQRAAKKHGLQIPMSHIMRLHKDGKIPDDLLALIRGGLR